MPLALGHNFRRAPKPLLVSDLKPGKPLLAFPFDAKAGKARNDVRLNKLVLMKFNEADLPPAIKARAAGGVIAYSAICTHQACDVKTWLSKEQALVCFCHASKFLLLDDYFKDEIQKAQSGWRNVVATAALKGIPVPAFSTALAFFDQYRSAVLPANLLQAQIDYFGAHTYERIDRPRGQFFHTNWTGKGGTTASSTYNV